MPDALKNSPAVGISLLVGFYVIRLVQAVHQQALSAVVREHERHLASREAEVQRLRTEVEGLKRERDKWAKLAT